MGEGSVGGSGCSSLGFGGSGFGSMVVGCGCSSFVLLPLGPDEVDAGRVGAVFVGALAFGSALGIFVLPLSLFAVFCMWFINSSSICDPG